MEPSYTIVGADGQQYGPNPLTAIQSWITEGRITKDTQMLRHDNNVWRTARDFSELQWAEPLAVVASPERSGGAPVAVAPAAVAEAPIDPALLARVKSGAGWFFWVAGLSLINTISALSGSTWRFIIGTGLTEVFNAIGSQLGSGGKIVAVALDVLLLGTFIVLGIFAGKRHLWAFVLGMLIYAGDAVIYLLVKDWVGVGFHAFVVFCMFTGFQAARAIKEAQRGG